MRAGPLSDKKIINTLNENFINAWIIIPQFENPDEFFSDPTSQSWAKTIASEFTYPVDSIVLSPQGGALAQGEYAKVVSPMSYLKMLENALEGSTKQGDAIQDQAKPKIDIEVILDRKQSGMNWKVHLRASGLDQKAGPLEFRIANWGEWDRDPKKFFSELECNVKLESSEDNVTQHRIVPPENWDGSIDLSYEVKMMARNSEARDEFGLMPWGGETYGVGFSSNTLMDLNQSGNLVWVPRNITFTSTNKDDTIASGWGPASKDKHQVKVGSAIDNTIILFGESTDTSIGKFDNMEIQVIQFGKGQPLASRLGKDVVKLVRSYSETTDLHPHKPVRVFLTDTEGGGVNVDDAMQVGYPPETDKYNETLMYTAHELYHDWLGSGFVQVENPQSVWFQEGFTDYLSLWHLARLKLITPNEFLDRLNLLHDLAVRESSVGKVAFGDSNVRWRDGDGANETMAYRGGALLAFYTDLEMRRKKMPGLSKIISDLEKLDRVVSNTDIKTWYYENGMEEFHKQWIEQPNFLNFKTALRQSAGFIDWKPTTVAYAGFNTKNNETFGEVVSLDPDGGAKKAGLKIGDRVGGYSPAQLRSIRILDSAPEHVYGMEGFEIGKTIDFGVFRNGKGMQFDIETKELSGVAEEMTLNVTAVKSFLDQDEDEDEDEEIK